MSFIKLNITRACFAVSLSAFVLVNGCQNGLPPRARLGAYFGSPTGMDFHDPDNLGSHSFVISLNEKNGMVYTCKAGFIDIGHVREAADRTAYIAKVVKQNLMKGNTEFSFKVIEPSRYLVTVSYPNGWGEKTDVQKEAVAKEASIQMGQFFAHKSLVWHEILTWYGFASTGIFPENISSFSCEDTYSDLLGTDLAATCLRNQNGNYNQSITAMIYQALDRLDVQPSEVAMQAAKKVKGDWYETEKLFFVDMKKRNFDVGKSDGLITPMLVDGICDTTEPISYPAPNLSYLSRNGFIVELKLEPLVWQKNKIYQTINLSRTNKYITPEIHFPAIIRQLENEQTWLSMN